MAMPERIGGSDDEKKPGLVIAFGMKKPKMPERIGGDDEEGEPEGSDESISNEQAMDDSVDELIAELKQLKPSRQRVKSALRAFFYACDAEPHDEDEHTEEEGEE